MYVTYLLTWLITYLLSKTVILCLIINLLCEHDHGDKKNRHSDNILATQPPLNWKSDLYFGFTACYEL